MRVAPAYASWPARLLAWFTATLGPPRRPDHYGLLSIWQYPRLVDRRLANRNIRTALIAGVIALAVFAASFAVGFIY